MVSQRLGGERERLIKLLSTGKNARIKIIIKRFPVILLQY